MFTMLSVITAVKDYVEIVHKLVETDTTSGSFTNSMVTSYSNFGAIVTYSVLLLKQFIGDMLSFNWLQNIGSLPVLVPNIASAMISEISVLDGYFHNAFTFLETPISYGNNNLLFYCMEKFTIGLLNSVFLILPTSTAHLICLRRFVMQGLEAGYIAGLGTIAGNMVWIGSIIFGLRFLVIPWLSLDILRYLLGFILLVKYMWDSYSERKTVLEDLSKSKIFLLNFLLAFTEQTNIYPFLSNLSISSDTTVLESFPAETFGGFFSIHLCYLLGIFLGSFSLLQLTCWFWENPAYNLYMWMISSFKVSTGLYYKVLNFVFLYLTMICAISSVSYFGLDYTLTNPLGFVHEDRLMDQKGLLETGFINTKASDRNTRRNRGRHGRRERWKRRVRRYRTFDASLYDQGVYDLFPIEDLNYGFDRFWLRRKIRNHRVHFRFFPGPWMRSFKKQLSRPRLESFMGPRVEFFRILFEQVYHPEFHEFKKTNAIKDNSKTELKNPTQIALNNKVLKRYTSVYTDTQTKVQKQGLIKQHSALRKFVRKVNNRIKYSTIVFQLNNGNNATALHSDSIQPIYSKRWKELFSKMSHETNNTDLRQQENLFRRFYSDVLGTKNSKWFKDNEATKKRDSFEKLSKKDRQILRYKTFLTNNNSTSLTIETQTNVNKMGSNIETLNLEKTNLLTSSDFPFSSQTEKATNETKTNLLSNKVLESYKPLTLLHPLKFYLQSEQAFQRKLKFYGANVYRTFGVENNAPYFRTMMRRFFYYYKPTLRWERTMHTATMRKARRKGARVVRKLNLDKKTQTLAALPLNGVETNLSTNSKNADLAVNVDSQVNENGFQKPTHFYSLVNKRATRYRYQIYKDVLQHWYYTPFNRLLLKFDVDSFIRRQPTSYFLTKKEEQLLHLRRLLLSEHYDTLRWYTSMQHYSSMKARIGGTKSFASRAYSQQFQGTFKKVRHLFALTPSASDNTILKFDQPLYNEYANNQNLSILNDSLIHEELLADEDILSSPNFYGTSTFGDNLKDQSTKIVGEYLLKSEPLRQDYMNRLLSDKNYWELTQFLFKGQKLRGSSPVTNERNFLNQEKDYLYTSEEKAELEKFKQNQFENFLSNSTSTLAAPNKMSTNATEVSTSSKVWSQNLWIQLFKKCQNTLYDQEALKSYLSRHVDKRKKQQQRQEKYLSLRLERLKNWFSAPTSSAFSKKQREKQNGKTEQVENSMVETNLALTGLTTSIQKGIKESILFQKNLSNTNVKSNVRNNRPEIFIPATNLNSEENMSSNNLTKSVELKNHLVNRVKVKEMEKIQVEEDLRKTLNTFNKTVLKSGTKSSDENVELKTNLQSENSVSQRGSSIKQKVRKVGYFMNQTLTPFKNLSKFTLNSVLINPVRSIQNIVQPNLDPNSEAWQANWRKQEMALKRRKKTRRTLKRLKNTNQRQGVVSGGDNYMSTSYLLNSKNRETNLRQKRDTNDSSSIWNNFEQKRRLKSWNRWYNNVSTSTDQTLMEKFQNLSGLEKKFKRKRSRLRRNRPLKRRSPIKKRTLGEKLKRQFKLLKRYSRTSSQDGSAQSSENKKVQIFQMITKRKYMPESEFQTRETKQRRTRFIKRRFWRRHKKQKYAQDKSKQRKRRRFAAGKIRTLNKEYKRIESNLKVKQWWWNEFLPSFKANVDATWELEADAFKREKFETFSDRDLLERDALTGQSSLQIGNKDYKPLALPEAIRIRENLANNGTLVFNGDKPNSENSKTQNSTSLEKLEKQNNNKNVVPNSKNSISSNDNVDIIGQVTKNTLFNNNSTGIRSGSDTKNPAKLMVNVNPIPFYAGWDESLRKFVVTNRLLSPMNYERMRISANSESEFNMAPLRGMNAATTLYWQVPFTTYDPDQFFALGMDGFSPIGWRKFHFRHSKQTTKPILVKSQTFADNSVSLISTWEKANQKNKTSLNTVLLNEQFKKQKFSFKNQLRRSQKRYKRVKKHPRPPVWFPSGPLTNQVLPVHYIYVFYKRYRLPRDRYIRRRLRQTNVNSKNGVPASIRESFTTFTDFTLRKRVKPRRKYHRKRHLYKTENLMIRRRAFRDYTENPTRERPVPPSFMDSVASEARKTKTKQRRKMSVKQQTENLRMKQLRRRVLRQVIRPVWRYRPRAGGYTWPGDYLRLELVKAPTLQLDTTVGPISEKDRKAKQRKSRKKKRRTIQEWQLQPKKYLLQKHNLKVLKKRLEKAQNSHKLHQRVNELTYLMNQQK